MMFRARTVVTVLVLSFVVPILLTALAFGPMMTGFGRSTVVVGSGIPFGLAGVAVACLVLLTLRFAVQPPNDDGPPPPP